MPMLMPLRPALSIASLALAMISAIAAPVGVEGQLPPGDDVAVAEDGRLRLHRFWNALETDNLYTTDEVERAQLSGATGYSYAGVEAYILKRPAPGTRPLTRLHHPNGDSFYMTDDPAPAVAQGYVNLGVIGHVYAAPQPGTVPLRRYFNPTSFDHYYTVEDWQDAGSQGYHFELIQGHVYPRIRCSFTGEPLAPLNPVIYGIIGNELQLHHDYDLASQRVAEANADAIRRSIKWNDVETQKDVYDWSKYDALYGTFDQYGLKPVVTLDGPTPQWASSQPESEAPGAHMPADIAEWEEFVELTVQRYGAIVKDWEVWNEPNADYSFRDGPQDYVRLLSTAYPIIHANDHDARVWAGQLALPVYYYDWFNAITAARGSFDGFSIHTFHYTPEDMVTGVAGFNEVRGLLDTHGLEEIPLSVTAAQIWDDDHGPNVHCPYRNMDDHEKAATLNDIYVCLANAGAHGVYWFKTINRYTAGWEPGICPNDYERSGVLNVSYERTPAYWAYKRIGDYLCLYRPGPCLSLPALE